jgi:mannitol/fructose-specific phosphotransferase system IIA component (Ntr-type)
MDYLETLAKGSFSLHIESDTKDGIIDELLGLMIDAGQIDDKEDALNVIMERENKMSTGMEHGIAIPHGSSSKVENMVTAFGLKKEGVDFSSLDGEDSKIFIVTISNIDNKGLHIQYLAAISKMLGDEKVREKLLCAESKEDVIKAMT